MGTQVSVHRMIGDWRFSRLIKQYGNIIQTTVVTTRFITADMQRVYVAMFARDPGELIGFDVVTPNGTVTVAVQDSTRPWLVFTTLEHGQLPTYRWEFRDVSGLNNLAMVIMGTLPEPVLTLDPQEPQWQR